MQRVVVAVELAKSWSGCLPSCNYDTEQFKACAKHFADAESHNPEKEELLGKLVTVSARSS